MRLFVPRAIVVDGLTMDHVPGDDIVGGIVAKFDCHRQIGLIWQIVSYNAIVITFDYHSFATCSIKIKRHTIADEIVVRRRFDQHRFGMVVEYAMVNRVHSAC